MTTVADNLRRLIADKENILNSLKSGVLAKTFSNTGLIAYKIEFLQININELRRILSDIEN